MADKVAMIGLDAAEWWLVEKYMQDGVMPHLDKLMSAGRFARLAAGEAFKAEGRWTEMLTGRSSEESQYWSIVDFDPATYKSWYSRSSHGSYFYARPDLTSIVFDVPNCVIVEDTHGLQVTAWGSHAAQFPSASRPGSVLADVDRQFGVHEGMLSDGHSGWNNDTYLHNLQTAMLKGIEQRVDISAWLREQEPDWDLFVTVFGESHVGEHQFMHGVLPDHPLYDSTYGEGARERLDELFAAMDKAIGDITGQLDESTSVVVFAAHGMEANKSDVLGGVLIPEVLHRLYCGEPLIDFDPWEVGDPYIVPDDRTLARHYLEHRLRKPTTVTDRGPRGWPKRIVRRIRHHLPETMLNTFERLYWRRPDWWEMNIRQPAPYHSRDLYAEAARIELESVASASWYRSAWPQMKAFVVPSFSDCHIRLNVRGRERDGVVDPAEYDAACAEVEAELRRVVDARTGEPIVDQIYRILADDPMAEIAPAPDLLVTFRTVTDVVSHPDTGQVGPSPLMRMGEHTPDGWAVITTPDGARGDLGTIEPRDLTATVVGLLGVPESPLVTGTDVLRGAEAT